jgi:hypothetical protein
MILYHVSCAPAASASAGRYHAPARRIVPTGPSPREKRHPPAQYDAAVTLLKDRHELARRPGGQSQEFVRRYAALREAHSRKPSLITRLDRAGLTTA